MTLEAVITSSTHSETRVLDAAPPFTIGRDPGCTISLASHLVSRRHVTVETDQSSMRVLDESRNGTLVGTEYLNGGALEVPFGTPLRVGEFTIELRAGGAAVVEAEAPEPALEGAAGDGTHHAVDIAAREA
jgi:pSer/pThr/pTyr-binding forkhead associated (FHA) protein